MEIPGRRNGRTDYSERPDPDCSFDKSRKLIRGHAQVIKNLIGYFNVNRPIKKEKEQRF